VVSSIISVADPNLFNCKVGDLQISYYLQGSLTSPQTFFTNYLTAFPGGVAEIWSFFTPGNLQGTELGNACDTLFFATGATPFPPAAPPYVGIFRPAQPFDQVFGQFPGGQPVFADWQLAFFFDVGTMNLQCWSITFSLHP
jgi:hypothetical protein